MPPPLPYAAPTNGPDHQTHALRLLFLAHFDDSRQTPFSVRHELAAIKQDWSDVVDLSGLASSSRMSKVATDPGIDTAP